MNADWQTHYSGYYYHEVHGASQPDLMILFKRWGKSLSEKVKFYREASDAIRMRDECMLIASHEIKMPLTALQLQLQLMSKLLNDPSQTPSSQQIKTLSESSLRQTRRLALLVNELMDLTQIQAGKFKLNYELCNLTEILSEYVLSLNICAAQKGCTIMVHANAPVIGNFDPSRMGRVVTNLVSNSIKYGHEGPIIVRIITQGDRAKIQVKDEGPGIPSEEQELIFQRFGRGTHVECLPETESFK